MKITHYIKGLSCTFLLLSNGAIADWTTIDESVSITSSKARYVRAQDAYIVQIEITNNGSEQLTGPFRILIENSSLPVKDQDGTTDTNIPYFDFLPTELMPNSSKSVTARFEYARRTSLTFDTALQNEQSNDSDNDGVNDEIDQCQNTIEGAEVDTNGCILPPPTNDSGLPIINFEVGGTGADFNWNVFENIDNPALQIVANPSNSETNSSDTVAMFTARADGAPWAGLESAHGNFGPMTLDSSNSTVKIMVYKSVISDVGLKFAIASGGAQGQILVANTLINEWEELTFDFSSQIGTAESINIDQIIVFPDFNYNREHDNVVYFDNITFHGDG